MTGCDGCGAQAGPEDRDCPVCGASLAATARRPMIPIRRYGTVPPPPGGEGWPPAAERRSGRVRLALLVSGGGAALAAAAALATAWPW